MHWQSLDYPNVLITPRAEKAVYIFRPHKNVQCKIEYTSESSDTSASKGRNRANASRSKVRACAVLEHDSDSDHTMGGASWCRRRLQCAKLAKGACTPSSQSTLAMSSETKSMIERLTMPSRVTTHNLTAIGREYHGVVLHDHSDTSVLSLESFGKYHDAVATWYGCTKDVLPDEIRLTTFLFVHRMKAASTKN